MNSHLIKNILIQRSKSLTTTTTTTTTITKFLHHKTTPAQIQTITSCPFTTTRTLRFADHTPDAKPPSDKMTPSDIRTYVGIFVFTAFATFVLSGEDNIGPNDGNGPMGPLDQFVYVIKSSFGIQTQSTQKKHEGPTEDQLLQFRTYNVPEDEQVPLVATAGSLFEHQQEDKTKAAV